MLATVVFKLAHDPSVERDILARGKNSVHLIGLKKEERQALISVLKRENWREILSEAALPGWGPGFWGL